MHYQCTIFILMQSDLDNTQGLQILRKKTYKRRPTIRGWPKSGLRVKWVAVSHTSVMQRFVGRIQYDTHLHYLNLAVSKKPDPSSRTSLALEANQFVNWYYSNCDVIASRSQLQRCKSLNEGNYYAITFKKWYIRESRIDQQYWQL